MTVTSSTLRPYLEECGYVGDRLESNYSFGASSVALAGFIGKPWDARSACLAVVDAVTESRLAAHDCIQLGAPTALVCLGDSLDWWQLSIDGPREPKRIRATEVQGFFRLHGEQLNPENIYAAKLRRPSKIQRQMEFVDISLMPALERRAGESLSRLVSQAILTLMDDLGGKVRSKADAEGVFKSVFWLLAAKLLREKRVQGFKSLDLTNVDQVFEVVGQHYRDARDYPPGDKTWKPAIARIAGSIANWGNLGNITSESLAYLYETALIDGPTQAKPKGGTGPVHDVRKILGIHSTPSMLVDHMLSQIWPLVDPDKLADQRVFEPACGHAAFLTAAMRDLRNWSGMEDSPARHRYLRERIKGIEIDPFSDEIAKLSLTLADVPHGNTWKITPEDMFRPGTLREAAKWATIVLSNPPYETFKSTQAPRYEKTAEPVTAQTKAVEMLKRVIPNLSPGAVFGFVLPQGTLYDKEALQLRKDLLATCEIAEISLFEDKLFSVADHEACILIGRRKNGEARVTSTMYRRVRNRDMEAFQSTLSFSREDRLKPSELGKGVDASLYEPDLRDVWAFTSPMPRLEAAFDVQQGFQLKAKELLGSRTVISTTPMNGFTKSILNASDRYTVWALPKPEWIALRPQNVRRPGAASAIGIAQVVLNYARLSREPWRLCAVIDPEGVAVSSRFLALRPVDSSASLTVLWAVLNSPLANAFSYCWTSKRETLGKIWLSMPLPTPTPAQRSEIEAAAAAYFEVAIPPQAFTLTPPDENAIRNALLNLDAAVLRLYNLPPALERQLLAIFDGVERPGVGCNFRGYPANWTSRPVEPSLKLPQDDRPVWERIASLASALPEEVIAGLPKDGASQLDHYLYGKPKRT
jgi:hypothetical protein